MVNFTYLATSVTRFDEISPLCKTLKVFGYSMRVNFLFCKILGLSGQILLIFGQIDVASNGPILKKYFSHLVSLLAS